MRDSQIIEEKLLRNAILDYNLKKTALDCPFSLSYWNSLSFGLYPNLLGNFFRLGNANYKLRLPSYIQFFDFFFYFCLCYTSSCREREQNLRLCRKVSCSKIKYSVHQTFVVISSSTLFYTIGGLFPPKQYYL